MIISVDFETYYDKEFSLSKMTTEEYVRDDNFEVIGVGVKVDETAVLMVEQLVQLKAVERVAMMA